MLMELQFYILIKKGIKKFKIVLAKKLSELKNISERFKIAYTKFNVIKKKLIN